MSERPEQIAARIQSRNYQFKPDPEMFVLMDDTGCYHVEWGREKTEAKAAHLKTQHVARYVLTEESE